MNSQTEFSAPWGTLLKCMTALCVVVLLGIPLTVITETGAFVWPALLPAVILFIGVFFIIRGYELRPGELIVKRLGWNSRIALAGLQSVEADPTAMNSSIRTFGNGGLFCFAGRFRNKKLGCYRAFATDLNNCVVLKFSDRIIVITPGDPEEFVTAFKTNH